MPPKVAPKTPTKVNYPPGVKEITDSLGTDELVRRLKSCAQAFQNMGQDDDNQEYVALSIHLAQDTFLEHSNKDVRLLVACCIADVFRVYAPDAPYKEPEHLKNIFLFFIKQLRGLEDPKDPAFKRYFYLLENLAWVKSFNICIELEENQEIFCQLFTLIFSIVNDDHSTKVKGFMLDMMAPLISEADSVSQELLDSILANIIEPRKTQNRNAYSLAKDLLKKTDTTIEPYIQAFFNNALILGKTSESDVTTHLYDLIYELNTISPSVLLAVLPQLEFKLKSNDEKERLEVTRLLARMFSDKSSELAFQHKSLWTCFLGRFNDISVSVRTRCVQYSMHFLLNHPDLRADITEQLKLRQHDPEESVRYEVVLAIISAAKKDFTSISDELLDFVKERTLDKKFKIRKEALVGLSMIYKSCMINPEIPDSTRECVSWIKNKVLHVYYQTALEDRLLVERILHTCLVPYQLPPEDRMKRMYQLYATVDDHAVKAFNELLKCQNVVRNNVRALLEGPKDGPDKEINQKITVLSKSLPEPVKAQEFLKKLHTLISSENRVRNYLEIILKQDCSCQQAEENVRELLKKLGNPVMTNVFYMTIKQLLERVAPVLVDKMAVQTLMVYVERALQGDDALLEELGTPQAPERGLKLLHILSHVFPGSFYFPEIYMKLMNFLTSNESAELTLRIFCNIGSPLEAEYPEIAEQLIETLKTFAIEGTGKQAKQAIKCLYVVSSKSQEHFQIILQAAGEQLALDRPHFLTALVTIGHIAMYCATAFGNEIKNFVTKNIVKNLLMQDMEQVRDSDASWCQEEILSDETRAKTEGMKTMVRWLVGLRSNHNAGCSALRLLSSVVEHDGDLMKRDKINRPERAWLRITAGCCILKLAQETAFFDLITQEQFQTVAKLINDECNAVRERFAQKLHKGLIGLKLPLDFMAIFAYGATETNRELKNHLKQYLLANINKRRDYVKQHPLSSSKLLQFLPDYVLPYAIHLMAHNPEFKKFDQVNALQKLKDCLWFLMEPLITKNENYSFGFYKRLLENIKLAKDKQDPENEMQNMKLYAVCDLALGLVMSKTANFVLKEFPVEPTLPSKLYTNIDRNHVNSKIYLPPELAIMFPKGLALDIDQHKAKAFKDGQTGQKRPRLKPMNANGNAPSGEARIHPANDDDDVVDQPSAKRILQGMQGLTQQEEVEEVEEQEIAIDSLTENVQLDPESGVMHVVSVVNHPQEEQEIRFQLPPSVVEETKTDENCEQVVEALVEEIPADEDAESSKHDDEENARRKRSTLASANDEQTAKRQRSFDTDDDKTADDDSEKVVPPKPARSASKAQPTEQNQAEGTTATALTRISTRQRARKQDTTVRREDTSEIIQLQEEVEAPTKKPQDRLAVKPSSSKTTASPAASTPARRNLRRTSNMLNGAGRSCISDEDSQESTAGSPRKSTRVQARNAPTPPTQTKESPSTLIVKRKPIRRVR